MPFKCWPACGSYGSFGEKINPPRDGSSLLMTSVSDYAGYLWLWKNSLNCLRGWLHLAFPYISRFPKLMASFTHPPTKAQTCLLYFSLLRCVFHIYPGAQVRKMSYPCLPLLTSPAFIHCAVLFRRFALNCTGFLSLSSSFPVFDVSTLISLILAPLISES